MVKYEKDSKLTEAEKYLLEVLKKREAQYAA